MCLPAAEVRPVGLARAARPPPAWGWGSSAHLLVGALSHPSFSRPTDRATDRTLRLSSPSRLPALARPRRPRTPPVREGRRDHGEPALRLVDHYFTLSSDVTPRWRSWANRSSSVRPHRCSSRWHSRPSRTRSRTRWSTSAANRRLNRGTLTRRARPVGRRVPPHRRRRSGSTQSRCGRRSDGNRGHEVGGGPLGERAPFAQPQPCVNAVAYISAALPAV